MRLCKRFTFISGLFVVLALPVLAKDRGFSGKWVIDKSASTASFEIPDNLTQQIKEKGSDVSILTTWREPGNGIAPLPLLGIMTTNLNLKVNGEDVINEIGPFKQASKTTQNGDQLVTEYTALVNGENVTGKWVRSLSSDGKQMTIDLTQQSGSKNSQGKLVFNRK
jgi:hypothetical protein